MKKTIKLFLGTTTALLCIGFMLAMPVHADEPQDIEIGKCKVESPGALCNKLVEIYGENSTIKYNTKNTVTCKYSTSVSVNGVQTTVYLSAKPTTGDVNISMGSVGKLVIDGTGNKIDEEDIGNPTKPNQSVLESILDNITFAHDSKVDEKHLKVNHHIIQKLNIAGVHYFMEDELSSVKSLLSALMVENPDEFIVNNFFKTTLSIDDKPVVIYANKEIPSASFDDIEPDDSAEYPKNENENSMKIILISSVGLLACVSAIVAFSVKSKNKKDNSK